MQINRLLSDTPKVISIQRKSEDMSFFDVEDKVTLSSQALKSEPLPEETLLKEVAGKKQKKETGFKVDSGNLKDSEIHGDQNLISIPIIKTALKFEKTGKVPFSGILPAPDTRQSVNFSCGASALQSVLMYWGDEYMETELMEMLNTTTNGTHPKNIVKVAKELGYDAEMKENLTLEDLEESIKNRVPVIVDGQAWREGDDLNKPWSEVWESGHYMVVVGLDDKNVYIEDPSILGSMGYMSREEFVERWHDYETEKKYIHLGIFIRGEKPSPPPALLHINK